MSDDSTPKREFADPKLAINRVYTRRGDGGQTSLVSGERRDKDDLRIACYGTVDELNAFLGHALVSARELRGNHAAMGELTRALVRVQHELFNLGSLLATRPDAVRETQPQVTSDDIERLEREIDSANEQLPALRSFVLPGGSRLSVELHVARTVCRRAERLAVTLARAEPETSAAAVGYLNRLSDALFVWSRLVDVVQGRSEALWDPNHGAA
ncbi:MAG: cob(I)yrinic acid a,c-diamide adenosyltransferase [Myxococcales bacterium]|nr:cob(I)yrinic acid a,c-diamide adenosyltransferase [Myxococcales bacterium]